MRVEGADVSYPIVGRAKQVFVLRRVTAAPQLAETTAIGGPFWHWTSLRASAQR
jgi:hypothetical protein